MKKSKIINNYYYAPIILPKTNQNPRNNLNGKIKLSKCDRILQSITTIKIQNINQNFRRPILLNS